jgi:BNR repeat-like domain
MRRTTMVILLLGLFFLVQAAPADWSANKRLTWTSGASERPAIAISPSGALHVVWHDGTVGNYEIYYKRSLDEGVTWGATQRLTYTAGDSLVPKIAADSTGGIHVVWQDDTPMTNDIYYKGSIDGGTTWSAVKRITMTSGESYSPVIAIDPNDTIHVVWYDYTAGDPEIYYIEGENKGSTWSAARRLTWTSGYSRYPAIAAQSAKDLHLLWCNNAAGNDEVYYRKSADGGDTWSAPKRLSFTSGGSCEPAMTIDPTGNICTVWYDYTPGFADLYCRRSTDGGTNWAPVKRITYTGGSTYGPAMALDINQAIYLVFYDDSPGLYEIYYKKSVDGGATWSANQRLTWTSLWSEYPAIAVDSNYTVHVLWGDFTPGNYEIYYKKGS